MLDGTVVQFFYGEFSKTTGKNIPVAQIQLVQVLVIE